MSKKGRLTTLLIIALLLAGLFIKAYYINYTETWERQHDVISFGAEEGHAAYIEYLLNNRQLPDFDPRTKWGFFQPPLHHIISAFTIYVSDLAGAGQKRSQENTQIPTYLYMVLLTVLSSVYVFLKVKGSSKLSYKNNKDKIYTLGLVCSVSVICLHPMFIFLSGSINNDALALVLSMLSLLIAAEWYDNPNIMLTIMLALIIGLSMVAKLTGGLTAVPIGILMFMKMFGFAGGIRSDGHTTILIKDRVKYFAKNYLAKALLFSVIVFPLGLSYSIYNKVRWGIPFNYIPPVGEQFPEGISIKNRLFDVATNSIYTNMISRGDSFDEYNVPLMIIKTSLFGEYSFKDVSRWMKPLGTTLFVSSIILIVLALVGTIYMVFSKNSKMSAKWKILLFGTYATYMVAYLYFAFSNNNFSAEDFRYSAICIVCEGVFLGLFTDEIKNEAVKKCITVVSLCFAASSFLVFTLLGIRS